MRLAEMAARIASILHGHIAHTMSVAPGTEASSAYTEAISGERTLIEFLELELLEADRSGMRRNGGLPFINVDRRSRARSRSTDNRRAAR